jgi:DNA-binding PucR family transcriptional regulator
MSDNYTDDDFDLDADDSNSIQALRRAANAAKKLKVENTRMKRELAFAKAGIPLTDPKMNYFVKGYEGELEPDAIREAATEAGFLATEAALQEQVSDANAEAVAYAQQRVMAASAGATSEDISEAAALARMESAMQEGGLEAMLDVARQYGIPTNAEY